MTSRLAIMFLLCTSAPTLAQNTGQLDLRVGKLEKEMTAVQRKVFPQGTPVQPDLSPAISSVAPGTPANAPIVDLTARVDGLERQLATLTGQVEQNSFRARQHEEALTRLQARVTTLEGGEAPTPADAARPATAPSATPVQPVAARPSAATSNVARPAAAKPSATTTKVDPRRKEAVAAIEIPSTGDATEDAYSYGYRLYAADFFPEAQVKLKEFVAKYPPSAKRWSYAQNLLGRAYYDEGKPALAAVAFYDNYQKAPRGERAAESLYWLGQSLTKLKKLPDACKVYDELTEVYGAKLDAATKARAAKGRADAKCAA